MGGGSGTGGTAWAAGRTCLDEARGVGAVQVNYAVVTPYLLDLAVRELVTREEGRTMRARAEDCLHDGGTWVNHQGREECAECGRPAR